MRPIIGTRLGHWDFIVNPIVDTALDGLGKLEIVPAERVAYNVSEKWSFAAEHYADIGNFDHILPSNQQNHSLFAVIDYAGKTNVELGIGRGLNNATDKWVVKLILGWTLRSTSH